MLVDVESLPRGEQEGHAAPPRVLDAHRRHGKGRREGPFWDCVVVAAWFALCVLLGFKELEQMLLLFAGVLRNGYNTPL